VLDDVFLLSSVCRKYANAKEESDGGSISEISSLFYLNKSWRIQFESSKATFGQNAKRATTVAQRATRPISAVSRVLSKCVKDRRSTLKSGEQYIKKCGLISHVLHGRISEYIS
jgi:hypothetical protein